VQSEENEQEQAPKSIAGYVSDDREVLFGFFNRFMFKPALAVMPKWVHPNALSVFGLISAMSSVAAMIYATQGHRWFYLISGLLITGHMVADNVDGPLARKTGRASALGELLDHGFDGVSAGAILLSGAIALGLSPPYLLALSALAALGFATTMSEQYHTGTLVIPAFSGTEGVTVIWLLCWLGFFANDPSWLQVDITTFSVSSGVLAFALFGYTVAIFPPLYRTRLAGKNFAEILPAVPFLALFGVYISADGIGLIPAIAVNVFAAIMGTRFIFHRRSGHPLVWWRAPEWFAHLCLIPVLAGVGNVDVWALGSLAFLVVVYTIAMIRAGRFLLANERAEKASAP